jgi:hypothetical protein
VRVGCEGAGEGVGEEGFVVGAEGFGLWPFGGGGRAAGGGGRVGAVVARVCLPRACEGEAREAPAREVEGAGFHSACVRARARAMLLFEECTSREVL